MDKSTLSLGSISAAHSTSGILEHWLISPHFPKQWLVIEPPCPLKEPSIIS